MKYLTIFLIPAFLIGCDKIIPEPTIDTSSDESLKKTSQIVRESISEIEREKFDEAVQLLAFNQIEFKDLFSESSSAESMEEKLKEALNGKTAAQIISEAERIKQQREETQRRQATEEIKTLEQKRRDSLDALAELRAFEITRSRFFFEDQEYRSKQPILDMTVENNTDLAVSRAYFEGTIASPDRSIPWLIKTFNYEISGGLEPGEKQSWRLAPNRFSDWGTVNAPSDAVFTVTVKRIDGADGKPLFSATEFSDRDEKRLNELKAKYVNN